MQFPNRDLRAPQDHRLSYLDEHIKSAMASTGTTGCAVAVVVGQKVVFSKGFGVVDSEAPSVLDIMKKKELFTPETSFNASSTLEHILSLIIASLIQQGHCKWETSVAEILPLFSFGPFGEMVTVGDVVSHRAGFDDSQNLLTCVVSDIAPVSSILISLKCLDTPSNSSFRGFYNYSPVVLPLLSHIAQTVSKKPLKILLEDFCALFDAKTTALNDPDDPASLETNLRDITRMAASLLGGWIGLDLETTLDIFTPMGALNPLDILETKANLVHGFNSTKCGWIYSVYRGRPRISFHDISGSFSTSVSLFHNDGYAVCMVSNKPGRINEIISNTVADFLLGVIVHDWSFLGQCEFPADFSVDVPEALTKQNSPPRSINYYTGVYTNPDAPSVAIKITLLNNVLSLRFLNTRKDCIARLWYDSKGFDALILDTFIARRVDLVHPRFRPLVIHDYVAFTFENGISGLVESLRFRNDLESAEFSVFTKKVTFVNLLHPRNSIDKPSLPPRRNQNAEDSLTSGGAISEGNGPKLPPRKQPSMSAIGTNESSGTGRSSPIRASHIINMAVANSNSNRNSDAEARAASVRVPETIAPIGDNANILPSYSQVLIQDGIGTRSPTGQDIQGDTMTELDNLFEEMGIEE